LKELNGMTENPLGIIILAAGEGKRMKSALPKVLHPIGGRAMLGHVLVTARALNPARTVVVTGIGRELVEGFLRANYPEAGIAVQQPQNGTGHAVQCARAQFSDFTGYILVLYGDCPLITAATTFPCSSNSSNMFFIKPDSNPFSCCKH